MGCMRGEVRPVRVLIDPSGLGGFPGSASLAGKALVGFVGG